MMMLAHRCHRGPSAMTWFMQCWPSGLAGPAQLVFEQGLAEPWQICAVLVPSGAASGAAPNHSLHAALRPDVLTETLSKRFRYISSCPGSKLFKTFRNSSKHSKFACLRSSAQPDMIPCETQTVTCRCAMKRTRSADSKAS